MEVGLQDRCQSSCSAILLTCGQAASAAAEDTFSKPLKKLHISPNELPGSSLAPIFFTQDTYIASAMGLFNKIKKSPPPTATDLVEDDKDVEKTTEYVHGEEGLQQPHHHVHPDIEKRVIRKMDLRVVALVSALYVLAFLDRSNIGNAKIAGMSKDLHLGNGNKYQWLLTIFYISYIVFEFQALMWKIVPPHIWLAFCVACWGLFATCQAATTNWSGMMALRFLLGISEAGFGPGIPYLLSFFYLRHEVGFRIAIFLSAAPLATTFSGALAYGCVNVSGHFRRSLLTNFSSITSGHSHFPNWRLLFLVEGLPTLLMAPVAFFFLPDTPAEARFLNEEEKVSDLTPMSHLFLTQRRW